MCVCMLSHPVESDSLLPPELQTTRLLCPWNFPGKNTGAGCHFFLQGIFPTQGLNLSLLSPASADRFFTTRATWEAQYFITRGCNLISQSYSEECPGAWVKNKPCRLIILNKMWEITRASLSFLSLYLYVSLSLSVKQMTIIT